MYKYYYSIENESVISIDEIKTIWKEYHEKEYPDFTEYVKSCSYLENGDLETITLEIKRQRKHIEETETDLQIAKNYLSYLLSIENEKA